MFCAFNILVTLPVVMNASGWSPFAVYIYAFAKHGFGFLEIAPFSAMTQNTEESFAVSRLGKANSKQAEISQFR